METLINENKKGKKTSLYLGYTIFFAIASLIVFSFFILYNKSFVFRGDGIYQHYNAFLYFGKNVREFIRNIFQNHNFSIPMWEWGLGPGSDTISYQLFYDPFFIFAIFTPIKYMEISYGFTVILRLYLAGITFCAYCRKMNCQKWTTVCAAIMYVFCAYTIFAAPRHPYFINPVIFMPLIFLGIEKIIRNESFVLFSLAVALAALPDFYFFYMIVLLTVLYVTFRLICSSYYRKPKIFVGIMGKLLLFSVIGVAISGVLLLPTAMSFAENNTRVTDTYTYNFLYSFSQYSRYPGSFVSATEEPTPWSYLGMAPMVYIGVIGSFLNKDKKQCWARIYLLVEITFLCFPIFGRIFNGFGYVTNRWVFVWSFVPAFLFAKEFPSILNFSKKNKMILSALCIGYTLLCLVLDKSRIEVNLVGLVLFLISLIFVCFTSDIKSLCIPFKACKFTLKREHLIRAASTLMTFCFVFYIAYYRYSKSEGNYLSELRDKGSSNNLLINERAVVWEMIDDNDFYRFDNSINDNSQRNFPIYLHQPTTSSYWSLNPCEYIEWRRVNNAYDLNNFLFRGLCSRAWLESQYCAKYFIATNDIAAQASIPYGYEYIGKKKGFSNEYYLYKSANSLSFGSTYESVMSRLDFEVLSIVERQQAALQSCIVDDDVQTILGSDSLNFNDYAIDYQLECGKNIILKDKTFCVKKNNSNITLSFNGNTTGELYVLISGLHYANGSTNSTLTSKCNNASYSVDYYSEQSAYSEGRTEYLLNLGYSEEERNEITLTFSNKGDYSFDSLKLICQPMEKLPEYIKARNEDVLENVQFTTNHISGTIDLDKTKFLCMSLPYSKGWTCYVDGQKTELLHANIAFSGLELQPGHHEIELKFCTPYLKLGVVLSGIGIVLLIAGGILFKNKERIIQKIQSARNRK